MHNAECLGKRVLSPVTGNPDVRGRKNQDLCCQSKKRMGPCWTPDSRIWMQSNFGVRVGRHKAWPYRGHGGRLRGKTWVGDRWHRQHAGDAATTRHGVRGALRGESPRTREGRRPDRTTAVVSDQGSVVRGGSPCLARGTRTDFRLVVARGVGKFPSILDRPATIGVLTRALCYATVPPNHIAERFRP